MPHEIIVVDNASTDGSVEAVARRLARRPRHRAGAQRRLRRGATTPASARRRGDLVLLLNSDTVVPAGRDRSAHRAAAAQPDAAVAGPRLVDADGRAELSFGPMISPLDELRQKARGRPSRMGGRARIERRTRASASSTGSAARVCWSTARTPKPSACSTSAISSTRRTWTSARRIRARGRRILFTPAAQIIAPARAIARAHAGRGESGVPPEPPRVLRETSSRGRRCCTCISGSKGSSSRRIHRLMTSW